MNKQLFVRTYLCTVLFSPRFARVCCCVRNARLRCVALLQCLALGSYFCRLCPPSKPVGFLGCFVLLALLHMAAATKRERSNCSCKWVSRAKLFQRVVLKHHTQLGTAQL